MGIEGGKKHSSKVQKQKERTLRAAWMISLSAPVATAAAYYLGRSTVQLADFFRRSSELVALFLAWWIFRKTHVQPSTAREQVRLENLCSLLIASVMLLSCALIAYNSYLRFIEPAPLGTVLPGLVVPLGGLAVNGWFWRKGSLLARQESTPVVESQWRLCRAKAVLDLCVLSTLICTLALGPGLQSRYIDLAGAAAIGVFLIVSAYQIGLKALHALRNSDHRQT